MAEWFLRLIGLSGDFSTARGETRLLWQHPWVLWLGLGLLLPAGYLIHRRQRLCLSGAHTAVRMILTGARVLILLLLAIVLASPYLQLRVTSEHKPIVAILLDHSRSMQLAAGPFEKNDELRRVADAVGVPLSDHGIDPEKRAELNRISRAGLAQRVVQQGSRALLQDLARRYDVRYYSFAQDLVALGDDLVKLPEPPQPRSDWGSATALGDAVAGVLEKAGDRPVAGIVLLTDGQSTGGKAPAEAARQARAAGTPIFCVPVGVSKRVRDVAIVDVSNSGLVALGDSVPVAVTIESQGFDGRTVAVQLHEGEKLLDMRELVLRGSEQQQLELTFKADRPGPHYLTVRIPPQAEEPKELHANNTESAFVRVSEEKLRVLYVEGWPRWDFRFLKNAMRRDHGLGGRTSKEPDVVLEAEWRRLPAARQVKAGLPRTVRELSEYHAIVLGDASPQLLTPEFIQALAEAVREQGVGLIVEAGPRYMPQAFDRDLQELLPVKLRPGSAGIEAGPGKPFRLQLAPEGAVHEAMRFHNDPGRNQHAWSGLPPYYWCIAAERPAPAATVLAWNPSVENDYGKLPLISVHYAGKGRVLLVGTDSIWLWRQNVGDRFFYKFWGQSLRHVARRDTTAGRKSWLDVQPYRVEPGEAAQVELMAIGPDGRPQHAATLPVEISGVDAAENLDLAADSSTPGRYIGKLRQRNPGEYRVVYRGGNPAVEARLRVQAATEEMRHPNVNRPALEVLARISQGLLLEVNELHKLPEHLKGEAKLEARNLEATLWDNWLMLAAVIVIYSIDVGLRRFLGLS